MAFGDTMYGARKACRVIQFVNALELCFRRDVIIS